MIADQLIKEHFPRSSGIPALVVWHRHGGLTAEDYQLIQKLSQTITEEPLESAGGVIPMHQMPPQVMKQFASEDETTLISQSFSWRILKLKY